MHIKNAAKAGGYFTWNLAILIISLALWRIAFGLIAGLIGFLWFIPFFIGYTSGVAIGLPGAAPIVTSIVIGFGLTFLVGIVAAKYDYECPKVDVSFTDPE